MKDQLKETAMERIIEKAKEEFERKFGEPRNGWDREARAAYITARFMQEMGIQKSEEGGESWTTPSGGWGDDRVWIERRGNGFVALYYKARIGERYTRTLSEDILNNPFVFRRWYSPPFWFTHVMQLTIRKACDLKGRPPTIDEILFGRGPSVL